MQNNNDNKELKYNEVCQRRQVLRINRKIVTYQKVGCIFRVS
jgi:hypothetical protein